MRILLLALGLAACGPTRGADGPLPFPLERGSALPPPAVTAAPGGVTPPQGTSSGGFDFGQWRSADPTSYASALQTRVRDRYAGRSRADIRTDLEANGFACVDGDRLDCRIEVLERDCAHDWYVVVERGRPEPVAGYDVMCLGAR